MEGDGGGDIDTLEDTAVEEIAEVHTFGLRDLNGSGATAFQRPITESEQKFCYQTNLINQTLRGLGIDPKSLSRLERAQVERALINGILIEDAEAGQSLATQRFYGTRAINDAVRLTQAEIQIRAEAKAEIARLTPAEKQELEAVRLNLAAYFATTQLMAQNGATEHEFEQQFWALQETIGRVTGKDMSRSKEIATSAISSSVTEGLADIGSLLAKFNNTPMPDTSDVKPGGFYVIDEQESADIEGAKRVIGKFTRMVTQEQGNARVSAPNQGYSHGKQPDISMWN